MSLNSLLTTETLREHRARWFVYTGELADGKRERYCSDYCRNRAKRDRALDRALAQI